MRGLKRLNRISLPTQLQKLHQSIPIRSRHMRENDGVYQRRAEEDALQNNLDYVSGLGVDCKPIQEGGACSLPNTVRAHAAYAMNAYYQSTGRNDYDCVFKEAGALTKQI